MIADLLPLGDQAVLAHCADEAAALRLAAIVRLTAPAWLVDVVQAYTSVALYYDRAHADFAAVADFVGKHDAQPSTGTAEGTLHLIPCCYDQGPDLGRVADRCGCSPAEVVRWHTETVYTVYAIGFCPGFPYLGYLPAGLSGVPRLETPRLRVEAGSVGLTGRQTGIYTEERPGGWNLVGRTPLELVNVREGYFPLRTGDRVQFRPIQAAEFDRLRGRRLETIALS